MGRRSSNEELHVVRNEIEIRFVIEEVLAIPSKEVEGYSGLCVHAATRAKQQ